jgi:SagB-type dehydrogenase family enzyme
MKQSSETIELPAARTDSAFAIERALSQRRSVRAFSEIPLTREEVAQLLWAAQGVTDADGLRTAPSAGALYPIEVYAVVGDVRQLASGIYRYEPREHRLVRHATEDRRVALAKAAYQKDWVATARAILAVIAIEARTSHKYARRAPRYVCMEAGHVAQNVLLQATALGLAATVVGAFDDSEVGEVLELRQGEEPLYLVAIGRRK